MTSTDLSSFNLNLNLNPESSGEMIGWVLRGSQWVLMGTHGFSWVLMGSHGLSVNSHGFSWVLSGYLDCAFLGSQGVLRQAPPSDERLIHEVQISGDLKVIDQLYLMIDVKIQSVIVHVS